MKKVIYIITVAAATLFTSCASSWLDQMPEGATITEGQYQQMDNALKGSVLGIYGTLYAYGGEHDVFGARSIDMYGDFTCGDMALKSFSYGWFQTDEIGQSYTRRGYLWSYYYDIIRLCNKALNAAHKQLKEDQLSDEEYIKENAEIFKYYAQILTMRGWAYANLQKWFCLTPTMLEEVYQLDINNFNSIPIYTEEVTLADTILGNPLSTAADVYDRIEMDLSTAIYYFDIVEAEGYVRASKQEVNGDVARLTLAYAYLNKEDNENALKYAKLFIDNTPHTLLGYNELTTTGFAVIDHSNWVWGQDVTQLSSTSLASFFGQVDIFSYSYAWAGDVKGIDENLYKEITDNHKWDGRSKWFNNMYNSTKKYQFAPDGKFYSPAVQQANQYKKVPTATELDRNWECDQVFMRTEMGYLIAAEAAARLATEDASKLSVAVNYLTAITDERTESTSSEEYTEWLGTLSGAEKVLEEIRYNWRVEMWGEGFGLQTFRRYNQNVKLGENHARSDKDLKPADLSTLRNYNFEIPSSESYYNPYLRGLDTETMAVSKKMVGM